LQEVADTLVEDVPEDKRRIIPDLPPAAKIAWLKNAFKMGFFEDKKVESLDPKRPSNQKPHDTSGMNPIELIEHGLKKQKK